MNKTIWVQTLVKNEGRYLWYGVKSVIDFVDRVLIWDTGSIDDTIEIIKLLKKEYPEKIDFKEIGEVDANGITKTRQQMLDETLSDWFILLDGDEIWWKDSISQVIQVIQKQGDKLKAIVVPFINALGDVYHFQEETAGRYQLLGRKGHLSIRAINRKIDGLNIKNEYPLEGYFDGNGKILQSFEDGSIKYIKAPYLHLTHLERSSILGGDKLAVKRARKLNYELGTPFRKDFKYPEAFYLERPVIVPSPWVRRSLRFKLIATLQTPLKKIKRKLIK